MTALVPLPNPQPSQCRRAVSRCAAIHFLSLRSNANFESQHRLSHRYYQRNSPWHRYYYWCRSYHHQYYPCHSDNVTGRPSHDSHDLQVRLFWVPSRLRGLLTIESSELQVQRAPGPVDRVVPPQAHPPALRPSIAVKQGLLLGLVPLLSPF